MNALDYIKKQYHSIDMYPPITLNHFGRKAGILNMFNDLDYRVGVEVGTERGLYAHRLLERCPNVKLYCVDPWLAYSEAGLVYTQEDFDQRYEETKERLKGFNCEIIKDTSMNAVNKFEDNSLDFVFIDGDHHYESVLQDITAWHNKVKVGGVMYGHDFVERDDFGVVQAVKEHVAKNNIWPLFLCHVPYRNGKGLVDCWMYIKQ